MEIKDEGICRSCSRKFSGRAMGKHLSACKEKKQEEEKDTSAGKKTSAIYHLRIWSFKPYWLHIEIDASAALAYLDNFLKSIWLECCGHMSEFTINGVDYSVDTGMGALWGDNSKSMDVPLVEVLGLRDGFDYVYDFGSSTHLKGQVFGSREGVLQGTVRILARNSAPQFGCTDCEGQATAICLDCDDFYCEPCLLEHDCGEEMALPVVNSPRLGVCAYLGDSDPDET